MATMQQQYLKGEVKEFVKILFTPEGLVMEHHYPQGSSSRRMTATQINEWIDKWEAEMELQYGQGKETTRS